VLTDSSGPISYSTVLLRARRRKTPEFFTLFIKTHLERADWTRVLVPLGVVVAAVFTVAYIGSYYLLPQGLVRGTHSGATADYVGRVPREFLSLFAWNVAVSLMTIGANTSRSVNTPLGYVLQVVQAPRYGTVWGTGSLAVGSGARITPLLSVLVERSGSVELTVVVAPTRVGTARRRRRLARTREPLEIAQAAG
jgi:hypothetical protein